MCYATLHKYPKSVLKGLLTQVSCVHLQPVVALFMASLERTSKSELPFRSSLVASLERTSKSVDFRT